MSKSVRKSRMARIGFSICRRSDVMLLASNSHFHTHNYIFFWLNKENEKCFRIFTFTSKAGNVMSHLAFRFYSKTICSIYIINIFLVKFMQSNYKCCCWSVGQFVSFSVWLIFRYLLDVSTHTQTKKSLKKFPNKKRCETVVEIKSFFCFWNVCRLNSKQIRPRPVCV